ncbi:MAG: NADP-dependent isocitrate dehydrogenase [Parachlamydia sp.]|jgi:isocitrate dehydrogenase|nr:NADP-dependent isocitrate dehydrogenase [Parachlamydia sp.]
MAQSKIPITVAEGDGIGPEIMAAVLRILEASAAPLEIKKVEIGEKVYLSGLSTGISAATWEEIRHSRAFLKAPITTPQGGGFKSLNVTVRTTLGLYANVRPCIAYSPFIETKHPGMNVVIIRENEEDLYTGIEYRQTPETFHALKVITRPGCEKIIRYAFEYALLHQRKKVTCFTKDNILKLTDGLFHKIFEEIGQDYPSLEKEHWIVDIGAAKLADTPTAFDVIVMPNLYGDILSDVAAQIAGSVGLAGSANIGMAGAMFEAIHGSAPRRAGQNLANPSGLLLAAVQMLGHLSLHEDAALIENAWLKTLEEGIHTYDIFKEKTSRLKVGTKEFADAVIANFGKRPDVLPLAKPIKGQLTPPAPSQREQDFSQELKGVDIFIRWEKKAEELAAVLKEVESPLLALKMISNRGVKVWPERMPETFCVDCWRCRFAAPEKQNVDQKSISHLLNRLADKKLIVTQASFLFNFEGQPGYTLSQDEQ